MQTCHNAFLIAIKLNLKHRHFFPLLRLILGSDEGEREKKLKKKTPI